MTCLSFRELTISLSLIALTGCASHTGNSGTSVPSTSTNESCSLQRMAGEPNCAPGTLTQTNVPAATATMPAISLTPDFGPNVLVFDPDMPASAIQSRVDRIFEQQEKSEFGTGRYAFLFKPGTYQNTVKVGYYTHVAGLGHSPNDVTIKGTIEANAKWKDGNALVNFWRAAENLAVLPAGGTQKWAVSQASPFRRMHVRGNLTVHDGGWSSGGFIADSKVEGEIESGTQQQWINRNSEIGRWNGINWNIVFTGVKGATTDVAWPKPPHTVIDTSPVTREKPFLTVDADGRYAVFVPSLLKNSRGISWASGRSSGTSIPLERFYIVKAGDTAASINAALDQGKHLLFTPGIYRLDQTLRITRPDTVVLGLGLATLLPENGIVAMSVADVDGVKLAGLIFDAGETNSSVLLEVGTTDSSADHTANPTSLHDLFFRIGGPAVGKADVSLRINSDDVIADHLWLWRADHGIGVDWTLNTGDTGLVVNGDDVTIYGLFVEHYQKYQTVWNGNGGRVYLYQSEIPYDPPNQAGWMNGKTNGFASYKLADSVTSHEAWGLGIYCYFRTNPSVKLESAIEAPTNGAAAKNIRLRNITTVSLGGGVGEITHIINHRGPTADPKNTMARLPE
ncbi:MAG: carbohydrate binding module family protein [Paucimonas sp.]|nr:carbohydrate binding module family protein [Paucimonas sp.]